MNLPFSPYTFPVYGLKLTKSEAILDPKTGDTILSAENTPVLLGGSDDEKSAKFLMNNLKKGVSSRVWRIWMKK